MKSLLVKNLFLTILFSVVLYSCNLNSDTSTTVSDDATITAFSINENDSSENASDAVFTINDETGIIENVDSLPYQTRIDSLIPSISFTSSDGYIINDTLTYNLYSTLEALDFTKPIKITNVASDGVTKKDYTVKLNVHKVDPYLYVWSKFSDKIGASVYAAQKAIYFKNKVYFFTNSGILNYVYTSPDAENWSAASVNNLPADVNLQNMDTLNNKIFVLHGEKVLTSEDGVSWSELTTDNAFEYKSMICTYQNQLYAVGKNKTSGAYGIIASADGATWTQTTPLPENFPVTGFAATSFKPKYGDRKMVIVGGFGTNGDKLNTRWSTENGYYWVNLKNSKSTFDPTSDGAVSYYGSRLILIGGTDNTLFNNLLDSLSQIRNSLDEGLTWTRADTTQIYPPTSYKFRKNASMVINPNNFDLYIIGGSTDTEVLSDVWKLKANYYNFAKEEWSKY